MHGLRRLQDRLEAVVNLLHLESGFTAAIHGPKSTLRSTMRLGVIVLRNQPAVNEIESYADFLHGP